MKPDLLPLPEPQLEPIVTTDALAEFCASLADEPFITVDTEFMREATFWPNLCLIQIAGAEKAVTIDPLADGIDLTPFFELMGNQSILKVFHAARQDLEIIWHLGRLIPLPVFDTQVAAMVCGFGDSISYEQLIQKICHAQIDKSLRFTDWARRPLTKKQLNYALSDVTHLRNAYRTLQMSLKEQARDMWVCEEMGVLTSQDTYTAHPENAWKRLKMRVKRPRDLAVMMAVAEWRDIQAQTRNVPRNRIIKDDAIYEIAAHHPVTAEALARLRSLPKGYERSRYAIGLIDAINKGLDMDVSALPKIKRTPPLPEGTGAIVDLLKVLLKAVADEKGVAARVIATVDDLTQIAADDNADIPVLSGWRRELFGEKALKLKRGELGLRIVDGKVTVVD